MQNRIGQRNADMRFKVHKDLVVSKHTLLYSARAHCSGLAPMWCMSHLWLTCEGAAASQPGDWN